MNYIKGAFYISIISLTSIVFFGGIFQLFLMTDNLQLFLYIFIALISIIIISQTFFLIFRNRFLSQEKGEKLTKKQIKYINKPSIGALLNPLIRTIGNSLLFETLLLLIPGINIFIRLNLVINGRKISREKSKKFGDIEYFEIFKKRQRIIDWSISFPFIIIFATPLFSSNLAFIKENQAQNIQEIQDKKIEFTLYRNGEKMPLNKDFFLCKNDERTIEIKTNFKKTERIYLYSSGNKEKEIQINPSNKKKQGTYPKYVKIKNLTEKSKK